MRVEIGNGKMTSVKLCKDCRWAVPEKRSEWNLRCKHPSVNAKDPWALSQADFEGTNCHSERERKWFTPCGQDGRLWEDKSLENIKSTLRASAERLGAVTTEYRVKTGYQPLEPFCWYRQRGGVHRFWFAGEQRPDDAVPLYKIEVDQ